METKRTRESGNARWPLRDMVVCEWQVLGPRKSEEGFGVHSAMIIS